MTGRELKRQMDIFIAANKFTRLRLVKRKFVNIRAYLFYDI